MKYITYISFMVAAMLINSLVIYALANWTDVFLLWGVTLQPTFGEVFVFVACVGLARNLPTLRDFEN